MDQYCVVCHNQKTSTAGVCLEGLDFSNPAANAAILEKVIRKVRTGEMPPAGMPRPAAPVSAAFTKSLEDSLDRAAAANPNPGRPAVHRLNRAEYSNAIRDLLALDIQARRAAAGGRFRLRLRQHRRRALDLARPARALHVGGAHGQPRWPSATRPQARRRRVRGPQDARAPRTRPQ